MPTLDRKQHLIELIDHYDLILENPDSPLNTYKSLIADCKYQCLHQLRKIREADAIGTIMANASCSPSLFTDSES